MRLCPPIIIALILLVVVSKLRAAGPAADPERYADYGGTPDLASSGGIRMSAEELDVLLEKLDSELLRDRVAAASEIRHNAAGAEFVYRKALWKLGNVRHRAIKDVLQTVAHQKDAEGGIVGALLQLEPRHDAANLATRVVVMLLSLQSLDTMAGYKVILDFSGRYAGAFRALIGDMMVHAGINALPALIYGRGSKNKELHMFAVAWIREMGNPLLSEQIQGIRNSRRLAQLLEAYASVNELDAIDVTLSCANHASGIVRKAARECLAVYGRNAKWSIHREFENTFGDEPKDGNHEQWVRKLYEVWDTQRQSKTIALFEKGAAAAKAANFADMDAAYRKLLSMSPLNPHRSLMARDYLTYAARLESDGNHEAAIRSTRMACRLSEENTPANEEATARLEWLHAEALRSKGVLDTVAYQKLQHNPALKSDATQWATYGIKDDGTGTNRWMAVVMVSILVFLSVSMLYWRVRARRQI